MIENMAAPFCKSVKHIMVNIVLSINSRYDLQSVTNFQHNEQYPNLKQNRLCSKF